MNQAPEESGPVEAFTRVLRMRGGFERVNHQATPNQLRLLGRVRNPSTNSWILMVQHLLAASEKSGGEWSIDISKQYFLRSGKVMFGWRVILQGADLMEKLPQIGQVVVGAPRARAIVEEQALPGVHGDRNAPSMSNRGKGAQSSLKATVGPMALAALNRG